MNISHTNEDCVTIKYSSTGTVHWVVRYSGTANVGAAGYSIAVDAIGNVYVTGTTQYEGISFDYMTIKYNAFGVMQWVSTYSGMTGSGIDQARKLKIDSEGNIYVTGNSESSSGNLDIATVKYSNAGVQQWAARYNGPANMSDYAYDMDIDSTGNIYVTGTCRGLNSMNDIVVIKYTNSGVQQWATIFDGTAHFPDISNALTLDANQNIYVTGSTMLADTSKDIITIKYNNNGVLKWAITYNGTMNKNDLANDIALDKLGNIYVTGGTNGEKITNQNTDFITIKYNSEGIQQWETSFDGPVHKSDLSNAITVDTNLNVYTAVYGIFNTVSYSDYITIKYSQPIGIKPISNEVPKDFILKQNYPNPFNPITYIEFSIPKKSYVLIEIFDILGIKVATLVNEVLNPGTYNVDWDGSNFASGVYFYKIIAYEVSGSSTDCYVNAKKLVLLK